MGSSSEVVGRDFFRGMGGSMGAKAIAPFVALVMLFAGCGDDSGDATNNDQNVEVPDSTPAPGDQGDDAGDDGDLDY